MEILDKYTLNFIGPTKLFDSNYQFCEKHYKIIFIINFGCIYINILNIHIKENL